MRLTPGAVLGPYEILDAIGAGGMGEVYRARDSRLGRDVALKVLPGEVTGDADRLARFEREARSSSALNHPNIVTIHDVAFAEEDCYLVMELIRGESLRDLISRGPVPRKKLLAIASGIADGLAAAHAAGIIHRDLKPENVMITAEGTAKILDFGLVKSTPEIRGTDSPTELRLTGTGVVVGTALYMAPEQARGARVGIQCDHFALGLIVYEMATGKHPFQRRSAYETVNAIIHDDPPPLDDSFPEPLVWIVERCLAKEPAERYASTADLAYDLAALRARSGSLRAGTGTSGKPKSSFTSPALLVAGTALLIAAIALGVIVARSSSSAGGSGGGLSDPIQLALVVPGLELHRTEVAVPVAVSPDGRYLVLFGVGQGGTNELWLSDLRSGARRLVAADAFAPAWSSDGRSIAYFQDGKLKTVTVDGGPARVVCDVRPDTFPGTPSWHGDTILFGQYSGGARPGLYRVDAGGGVPELLIGSVELEDGFALPWWPEFLPDGKRFLYINLLTVPGRNRIDHEVMLGSLDGALPRKIADINSRVVFADGHLLFVRDGTLLAQPFDVDAGRLVGEAKPLVDDLHYFRSTGMAAFSVSRNGFLAWRTARPQSRLVWMDRTGMEGELIATAYFDVVGRLSQDGTRYTVGVIDSLQGISDVWTYDLTRASAERLTSDLLDQRSPIWAADGRTIYYRSDGYGGPPNLFELRPGEPRGTMLYRGPSVDNPEDLSPDGRSLLFTTFLGSSDIYRLPLDPRGESIPYLATRFHESSPRFSPDGAWVVYSSNISGRAEVYVRAFEGAGQAMRISRDGGVMPRWSLDGKEILFFGPAGRMMSVTFDGTAGVPRMLFQAPNAVSFETGPDRERFLVQLEEKSGEAPVQLLLNWRSRLEAAVSR
jgi:eukaryotic-like serine/threonine-protein kinase